MAAVSGRRVDRMALRFKETQLNYVPINPDPSKPAQHIPLALWLKQTGVPYYPLYTPFQSK